MRCQDYELALGDYVDGTLDPVDRDALTAHLAGCARCQALVADLDTIRSAARNLEPALPAPQVWTRLSAAIDAERQAASRPWRVWWQPLAASVVIATLALSLSWVGARLSKPSPATTPPPVNAELVDGEAEFTTAIAGLESITKTEQSALDMDTAEVLQASLTVVDGAISESRAALASEPDSRAAQESLFEALRSKVDLLQDIVALINEMRKGNPDGAARIVSGLNQ